MMGGRLIGTALIALVPLLPAAPAAQAQDVLVSTKSRANLTEHRMSVLDGLAAERYGHSARLQPKPQAGSEGIPAYRGKAGRYHGPALAAARRHGIPGDLFLRLVHQESAWNPAALSHKGAIGLAQLMPATARRLGVDPADPMQNLEGGARYLRAQYDRFRSWRLALAAYNAGPEAVERHGGVPPYRETQGYVKAILGR